MASGPMIWRGPGMDVEMKVRAGDGSLQTPPFESWGATSRADGGVKSYPAPPPLLRRSSLRARTGFAGRSSPSPPPSRKVPISAPSPAILRVRWAHYGHVTMLRRTKAGPFTRSKTRFRWTNSTKLVRARTLQNISCRLRRGWTTSRLLTSLLIRQECFGKA